jgi:short-subunit dehydrogenase/uncharacterized tellurite resistance protein B-like protein
MFDALRRFVEEVSGAEVPDRNFGEEDYRLAAVALLVHVANVDGRVDLAERRKLQRIIKERFGLDASAAAKLTALAEQSDREAVDFYHFTSVLKRALDDGERLKIVEMLWDIAFADGAVHELEENTIWRIAELLGVSTRADGWEPSVKVGPDPQDAWSRTVERRVTLITGASGGIGADLARVFARHGHDLALVARRRDNLEVLADEIAAIGRPRPLVLAVDLAEQSAINQIAAALNAIGARPEILVNNAGFGLVGEALELDQAEQLAIIDLNIRVAMEMILRFLPAICKARGKILNVASVASYFPGGPRMAAYYASKAFLLSFSLALHQELGAEGVTVSALSPGYTRTGFQARAGLGADMGLTRFRGSSSMEVAEAGYAGLMAGRREIVPGFLNKLAVMLLPFLPKSIVLKLVSWLQQNRARLR